MCYLLEGKEYKANVGDVVTVQPGQRHTVRTLYVLRPFDAIRARFT